MMLALLLLLRFPLRYRCLQDLLTLLPSHQQRRRLALRYQYYHRMIQLTFNWALHQDGLRFTRPTPREVAR